MQPNGALQIFKDWPKGVGIAQLERKIERGEGRVGQRPAEQNKQPGPLSPRPGSSKILRSWYARLFPYCSPRSLNYLSRELGKGRVKHGRVDVPS